MEICRFQRETSLLNFETQRIIFCPLMDTFVFHESCLEGACFSAIASIQDIGEPSDFTIRVGNIQIMAHQHVLEEKIPYFSCMFRTKLKETRLREVTMHDVDAEFVNDLVNFAYTNSLTITAVNVVSLLEMSNYLQINSVTNACFNFMWKRISPKNIISLLVLAESANNREMMKNANCFIKENFDEVSKSSEFLKLSVTKVIEIVSWGDLNALNERTIFKSVMKWVKAFREERTSFLPELLCHVRLPLLTRQYLGKIVSSEELIRESPFCLAMVDNARNFHAQPPELRNISPLERFCRGKHHLRCAKRNGSVMYSVCRTSDLVCSVSYYDRMHQRWHSLCETSIPNCFMACNQKYIYAIGHSFIGILDLKTMKRSGLKLWTSPSLGAAIILHRNQIFLFGGLKPLATDPSGSIIELKNDVLHLEMYNGQCVQMARMQIHRACTACASLGDSIYITGGITESLSLFNSVEVFDPSTGISREISPMHTKRFWHMCASLAGKVYVCGGTTLKDSGEYWPTSTCEFYDPQTEQWTSIADMIFVKIPRSLYAFRNKLYVAGLTDDLDGKCYKFEIYNSHLNYWTAQHPSFYPNGNKFLTVLLSNSFSGL